MLYIRSVSGRQAQRRGIRFPKSLFGFNGRHCGRTKRDDRRHRLAGHRLPDQRTATANNVRRKRTTRTSQRMDSDERHGPRRQSGKKQNHVFILYFSARAVQSQTILSINRHYLRAGVKNIFCSAQTAVGVQASHALL